jgi:hypothetical protein
MSVAMFDRLKKDDSRHLLLKFRKRSAKECLLRFEHMADRDQFCMEAHLVNSELVFTDDAQWTEGVAHSRTCARRTHTLTALSHSLSTDTCAYGSWCMR